MPKQIHCRNDCDDTIVGRAKTITQMCYEHEDNDAIKWSPRRICARIRILGHFRCAWPSALRIVNLHYMELSSHFSRSSCRSRGFRLRSLAVLENAGDTNA